MCGHGKKESRLEIGWSTCYCKIKKGSLLLFFPVATLKMSLPEFKYSQIAPGSRIGFVGKRGCGKTQAMHAVLKAMVGQTDELFVFSPSYSTRDIMSGCLNVMGLDVSLLEKTLTKLEENREQIVQAHNIVVLDDICMNKEFLGSKALMSLLMNARVLRCTVLMSAQDLKSVPPYIRENWDFTFVFYEDNEKKRRMIQEYLFPSLQDSFDEVFDKHTEDYSAIVSQRSALSVPCFKLAARTDGVYGVA